MSRQSDTTVIVPTYNRSVMLREALSSLAAQTTKPIEIIVVDDGSTDETADVVAGFPGVQYTWKANGGKAAAMNYGLNLAKGSLIWVCDDDDIAEPDALENLSSALAKRPDAGFAFGLYANFGINTSGQRWLFDVSVPSVSEGDLFLSLLERCYLFQGLMLVRRSCFDEVGPFNEELIRSQDFDMLLRLTRRYRGCRVDRRVYLQRQHTGTRGTAGAPISHSEIEEAWALHDQLIMRKILPELDVRELIPSEISIFGDEALELATLTQSVISLRKNMWPEALAYMRTYAASKNARNGPISFDEMRILSRGFDGYSRGLIGAIKDDRLQEVLAVLSQPIRETAARELSNPVPALIRLAIRARQMDRLGSLIRLYTLLRGGGATSAILLKTVASIVSGRIRGDAAERFARFEASLTSDATGQADIAR